MKSLNKNKFGTFYQIQKYENFREKDTYFYFCWMSLDKEVTKIGKGQIHDLYADLRPSVKYKKCEKKKYFYSTT